MSQLRRQLAIFTANRETAFRAGLIPAGTKLLRLEPEGWLLFSRPRSVPAARCDEAWRNDIGALLQNFFEGMEPGKDVASSPYENRGENNMPRSTLSENLT